MKKKLLALALVGLFPYLAHAVDAPPSSCVSCHGQLDGELGQMVKLWGHDAHAEAGLGCESCHGGDPSPAFAEDPEAAMTSAKGFRPKPDRLRIPDFCARCHSDAVYMKQFNPQARVDQLTEYRTSLHGKRNAAGDPIPAVCTDCHGAHGVRPVTSPESPVFATNVPQTCARCHSDETVMGPYNLPTDPYEKYRESVHGAALLERGDVAAPACNDCHGNHGAAPPGVASVANVCGQCHAREAALFRASFKMDLFESLGVAECTVCHDHHRITHPTPELFHGTTAPTVSVGTVTGTDPFAADIGDLDAGAKAAAEWRIVIRPHLAADDPRLANSVEITSAGGTPIRIDATTRPGDATLPVRTATASNLTATLTTEGPSGLPVEAGDALALRLDLVASGAVRDVKIKEVPGGGTVALSGSACRTCHTPGDACDLATDSMYVAIESLERNLRGSASLLRRAEIAGMEVSGPLFELKSKGTTADVEARSLVHTFEPDRLIDRAEEGEKIAAAAFAAGKAAMAELQNRRKGLAVSLILIVFVLGGLLAKIRQVDRDRRSR